MNAGTPTLTPVIGTACGIADEVVSFCSLRCMGAECSGESETRLGGWAVDGDGLDRDQSG